MKIAVVDDSLRDMQRLEEYLKKYRQERSASLVIDTYAASVDFLEEYSGGYDVIFLDIEMPGSYGLEVAREIREKDQDAAIIFVTNMAQYAIRGYEVSAVDFMVKPVSYFNFSQKMDKAIYLLRRGRRQELMLHSKDGVSRVPIMDILYAEKEKNYLVIHTRAGEFREQGTIQELKSKLSNPAFAECTAGYLVNLHYVMAVGKDSIKLCDRELPLSRRMRKEFMQAFIDVIGDGLL